MDINKVAGICKAMADPNRLQIIKLLYKSDRCANELLEELDITQPTLSHHMKILCESGIVRSKREGKYRGYYLCCRLMRDFNVYLSGLECKNYGSPECHCTKSECGADKCVVCSSD